MTTQAVYNEVRTTEIEIRETLEEQYLWTQWMSPTAFNAAYPEQSPVSLNNFIASGSDANQVTAELEAMYIFLDNSQMKLFASSEHSYLITTVRHHPVAGLRESEQNIPLTLFEPVKELVWMAKRTDCSTRNDWFNFTNYEDVSESESDSKHLTVGKKKEIIKNAQIKLNNQPRIQQKASSYFSKVQPFWYYKNTAPAGVNVFSFSLFPKQYQPSGSCNMTQVRKLDLCIDTVTPDPAYAFDLSVYTVGYNILRIQNGTGGLVFSS